MRADTAAAKILGLDGELAAAVDANDFHGSTRGRRPPSILA
jgi:hypothetical protein